MKVNESITHVEYVMKRDNDYAWEHAVKNEQYSQKNNLRIHGLEEEDREIRPFEVSYHYL